MSTEEGRSEGQRLEEALGVCLALGQDFLEYAPWTSLVVQRSRIHLPVQGTLAGFLVWEDPTCHRADAPTTIEPKLQLLKPMHIQPVPLQQAKPPK